MSFRSSLHHAASIMRQALDLADDFGTLVEGAVDSDADGQKAVSEARGRVVGAVKTLCDGAAIIVQQHAQKVVDVVVGWLKSHEVEAIGSAVDQAVQRARGIPFFKSE